MKVESDIKTKMGREILHIYDWQKRNHGGNGTSHRSGRKSEEQHVLEQREKGVKRKQRSDAAERPGEKVPEAPQDVARRMLLVTWARAILMQSQGRGHTVAKQR